MDRFDKVFCWTITVIVVGSGCYVLATTRSVWEGITITGMCTACVWVTWTHVADRAAKQRLDAARRRFDAAAVAFMRALDDGVAGSPSVYTAQGRELLAAWNDYHQELDGTAELVRRLRR